MSKRVNLSLTEGQYDLWSKLAEDRNISIHDFIKQAVRIYVTMLQKRAEDVRK